MRNYLSHHGILGQKWGVKNGPPYPLKGGSYTRSEKKAIYSDREKNKSNSIYSKRYVDKVIGEGTELQTLSFDKDRTKNTDVFFATYDKHDKDRYMSRFNRPDPAIIIRDEKTKKIKGLNFSCKWNNINAAKHDIKVASEDTQNSIIKDLYENNRDFYNFVTDPNRLYSHPYAGKRHERFKEFRKANRTIEQLHNGKQPTEEDINIIGKLINYAVPLSDDTMDPRMAKDVKNQQRKIFNKLKQQGYGAMLDTNDAMYGGLKANAPVIVFDMEAIIPKESLKTNYGQVLTSTALDRGREIFRTYQ